MPTRDFGAVCDTSVLTDRESLERAQELFEGSGLYIPNATYSWLSRTKLIQVRHQTVKHSLLKQAVKEREVYPINLPEFYDELGRQIMFKTDHNVALTDLRGMLLAAHLQLPILTFDEGLIERISEEIGIQTLERFEAHADWLVFREALELYRKLLFESGKRFHDCLENGGNFPKTLRSIKKSHREHFEMTKNSAQEISEDKTNPGSLEFHYLAWDILPSIREYYEQNIVKSDALRRVCERGIVLLARPLDSNRSDQKD